MKTLDDAWNHQDWDTFSERHTEDVIVRWPGPHENMSMSTPTAPANMSFRVYC
jgi:hypothetical protein